MIAWNIFSIDFFLDFELSHMGRGASRRQRVRVGKTAKESKLFSALKIIIPKLLHLG